MALFAPVLGRRSSVDQIEELVRLARQGLDNRQVAERVSCALSTVYALVGPAILRREDRRSLLHLSLADRDEIRAGVERGASIRAIGSFITPTASTCAATACARRAAR